MEEKKEMVEKAPEPTVEPAKKGKGLIIGLVVVILLLIGGLAFAFYEINTLKEENKTSEKRSKKDKEEDEEEEKEEKKSTKKEEKEDTKKSSSDLLAPITADGKAFNITANKFANVFVEFINYSDPDFTIDTAFLELTEYGGCGDYPYCYITAMSLPNEEPAGEYVVYYSNDKGETVSEVSYVTKAADTKVILSYVMALVFTASTENYDTTELVNKMDNSGCFSTSHCKLEYKGIGIEVYTSTSEGGTYHQYSFFPAKAR